MGYERREFRSSQCLLEKTANVNDQNTSGSSVLMWAAENGYLEIVSKLIVNGANITTQNNYGHSAVMIAARNGHLKVHQLLKNFLKWQKLVKKEKNYSKKIIFIITNNKNYQEFQKQRKIKNVLEKFLTKIKLINHFDENIIKFLNKEFINNIKFGEENYSILHIAVLNYWQELVTYLMQKWPININYCDNSRNLAWNYACLLLQKANALIIKEKNQINAEDRKF